MKPKILILTLLASLMPAAQVQAQDKTRTWPTVVEGNNQFAMDLYQQLGKKPGNKFFSPYSISTALGMTYAGAKGQTAKEMAEHAAFRSRKRAIAPCVRRVDPPDPGDGQEAGFPAHHGQQPVGQQVDLHLNANFLRITQTDYQAGLQAGGFHQRSRRSTQKDQRLG